MPPENRPERPARPERPERPTKTVAVAAAPDGRPVRTELRDVDGHRVRPETVIADLLDRVEALEAKATKPGK